MALGSAQPLTEKSTRNLPGGKGWPARGADNLTAVCEPIVYRMWEPRRFTTLWVFMACYRDSFTFTLPYSPVLCGLIGVFRIFFLPRGISRLCFFVVPYAIQLPLQQNQLVMYESARRLQTFYKYV
jgi:hypothetical protein